MAKFQLMFGQHIQAGPSGDERKFAAGSIIESKKDLARRWPEKFIRVSDHHPSSEGISTKAPIEPDAEDLEIDGIHAKEDFSSVSSQVHEHVMAPLAPPVALISKPSAAMLSKMSAKELSEIAAVEEIDLTGAEGKVEMLARVKSHFGM